MGNINPLLRLPAGRAMLDLPKPDRDRIEAVMRNQGKARVSNMDARFRLQD